MLHPTLHPDTTNPACTDLPPEMDQCGSHSHVTAHGASVSEADGNLPLWLDVTVLGTNQVGDKTRARNTPMSLPIPVDCQRLDTATYPPSTGEEDSYQFKDTMPLGTVEGVLSGPTPATSQTFRLCRVGHSVHQWEP